MAGYSRLMGEDEAGTLATVRKIRTEVIEPKVAEHQGRLFKSMGDGFLVEFASVVNAVACAAAIQKAMAARNADQPEDRLSNSASASTSATSSRKTATSMATA